MKLLAYAKLNLFLNVTGRSQDGYHLLDMVNQSVSLADTLLISPAKETKVFTVGADLPSGRGNLAYDAAEAFFSAAGLAAGAEIRLTKRIPQKAGLGGGSADAAAVLIGLNELYAKPFSGEALRALGKTLGSDVPFSLEGGCALVGGRGEQIWPLKNRLCAEYLIIKPEAGVSTASAFAYFDRYCKSLPDSAQTVARALCAGERFVPKNVLEPAARALCPEIDAALAFLSWHTPVSFLTGSGSACVGVFFEEAAAKRALSAAKSAFGFAALARAVPCGIQVEEDRFVGRSI